MTHKERTTINLLRKSLRSLADDHTKAGRDRLDITAMAAQQVIETGLRLARQLGPLENDAKYWLHLSCVEAQAMRLAARAARSNRYK
ncbi:MAG: hypothetical protein JWL59_1394 [Chthoniobacteraceae bacterium]|nr:hypothetical protein [Chthoniobacteraceae bacterium]